MNSNPVTNRWVQANIDSLWQVLHQISVSAGKNAKWAAELCESLVLIPVHCRHSVQTRSTCMLQICNVEIKQPFFFLQIKWTITNLNKMAKHTSCTTAFYIVDCKTKYKKNTRKSAQIVYNSCSVVMPKIKTWIFHNKL